MILLEEPYVSDFLIDTIQKNSFNGWTDTEGSLAVAVEEMPAGYDELMKPVIENIPALIFVLILTIPVSILAIRLAIRTTKKCDLL